MRPFKLTTPSFCLLILLPVLFYVQAALSQVDRQRTARDQIRRADGQSSSSAANSVIIHNNEQLFNAIKIARDRTSTAQRTLMHEFGKALAVDPNTYPVLALHMEDKVNNRTSDSGRDGHTAALQGQIRLVRAAVLQGFSFNARSRQDAIDIPPNDQLDLIEDFTIELYLAPSNAGRVGILAKGDPAQNAFAYRLELDAARQVHFFNPATGWRALPGRISARGSFFAMTLACETETNCTIRSYIDGRRQGELTGVKAGKKNRAPLRIGSMAVTSVGGRSTGYYNGVMDELMIYDYVRTDEQIQESAGYVSRGIKPWKRPMAPNVTAAIVELERGLAELNAAIQNTWPTVAASWRSVPRAAAVVLPFDELRMLGWQLDYAMLKNTIAHTAYGGALHVDPTCTMNIFRDQLMARYIDTEIDPDLGEYAGSDELGDILRALHCMSEYEVYEFARGLVRALADLEQVARRQGLSPLWNQTVRLVLPIAANVYDLCKHIPTCPVAGWLHAQRTNIDAVLRDYGPAAGAYWFMDRTTGNPAGILSQRNSNCRGQPCVHDEAFVRSLTDPRAFSDATHCSFMGILSQGPVPLSDGRGHYACTDPRSCDSPLNAITSGSPVGGGGEDFVATRGGSRGSGGSTTSRTTSSSARQYSQNDLDSLRQQHCRGQGNSASGLFQGMGPTANRNNCKGIQHQGANSGVNACVAKALGVAPSGSQGGQQPQGSMRTPSGGIHCRFSAGDAKKKEPAPKVTVKKDGDKTTVSVTYKDANGKTKTATVTVTNKKDGSSSVHVVVKDKNGNVKANVATGTDDRGRRGAIYGTGNLRDANEALGKAFQAVYGEDRDPTDRVRAISEAQGNTADYIKNGYSPQGSCLDLGCSSACSSPDIQMGLNAIQCVLAPTRGFGPGGFAQERGPVQGSRGGGPGSDPRTERPADETGRVRPESGGCNPPPRAASGVLSGDPLCKLAHCNNRLSGGLNGGCCGQTPANLARIFSSTACSNVDLPCQFPVPNRQTGICECPQESGAGGGSGGRPPPRPTEEGGDGIPGEGIPGEGRPGR